MFVKPLTNSMDTLSTQYDRPAADRIALALADQMDCVWLVCNCDSQLLYANRAGHRIMADGSILLLVENRVVCASTSQGEWTDAVRGAALHRRCRLFWLDSPGDRVMVVAMPIVVERLREPAAVLSLGRRSACSGMAMELLAARHRLSFAERRVFDALLNNTSPRDIAAAHGVTSTTIRTLVRAVRVKLGVRTTAALLQRAAQLPPLGYGP